MKATEPVPPELINPAAEFGYPDERQIRSPYSAKQQLQRICWWIGCFLLFKLSLRPMYAWRRWVLRLYGAKLADHVCVQRSARIEFPWNLEMGRYSCLGEGAWVYTLGKITIGEFTTISQRAFLCAGTHDYTRPEMPLLTPPITIGKGVWIAADAFVGPGVSIGDNAVVGARSVVVGDLPPGMVCAGHPCKPIKPRLPSAGKPKLEP
jgi:putative colanic acid biosynthesis acetyltransferase WcaF